MQEPLLMSLSPILRKIIFFFMLLFVSSRVHAEYYFVRSCSSLSCMQCCHMPKHKQMIHQKKKWVKKKHHVVHHYAVNHRGYSHHPTGCAAFGNDKQTPVQHDYNADLSTGDDDASVYPGMQIN